MRRHRPTALFSSWTVWKFVILPLASIFPLTIVLRNASFSLFFEPKSTVVVFNFTEEETDEDEERKHHDTSMKNMYLHPGLSIH